MDTNDALRLDKHIRAKDRKALKLRNLDTILLMQLFQMYHLETIRFLMSAYRDGH